MSLRVDETCIGSLQSRKVQVLANRNALNVANRVICPSYCLCTEVCAAAVCDII